MAFCFLGTSSFSSACAFCLLVAVCCSAVLTSLLKPVHLKSLCHSIGEEVTACFPVRVNSAPVKRIPVVVICPAELKDELSELIKHIHCKAQYLPEPVQKETHRIICFPHSAAWPKPLPPYPEERRHHFVLLLISAKFFLQ